jgi:hypothetical protein
MIVLQIKVVRTQCIKLLFYYVNLLLERNLIDEVHIVNKLVHPSDTKWLKNHVIADKRVRIFETGEPVYTPEDQVIHCADSIVFIDVRRFEQFVKKKTVSANVINGSVSCALNQRLYGFLSADLFTDDVCTAIYKNASAANEVHNIFLEHFEEYMQKAESSPDAQEAGDGSHFYVDNSTGIDMSMIVVNLCTVEQVGDGFDDSRFLLRYTMLKDKYADILRNGGSDCKAH